MLMSQELQCGASGTDLPAKDHRQDCVPRFHPAAAKTNGMRVCSLRSGVQEGLSGSTDHRVADASGRRLGRLEYSGLSS
jgi:hypothetical protein